RSGAGLLVLADRHTLAAARRLLGCRPRRGEDLLGRRQAQRLEPPHEARGSRRPGAWDGSIGLAGLLRGLLANLRGERRAAAPGAQLVDGIVDVLPGAVILVLGERLLKAHVAGTPGRGRLAAIVARDGPHESAPVLVLGKRRLQPGACLLQRSQLIRCGPGCHRPPPAILGRACEAAKAQNAQSLQRTSVARNQPFLRSLRR